MTKEITDTVARFGGEEFAAILPGTNIDQSVSICKKIRINVEGLKFDIPEESVRFTISIKVLNIVGNL
ncbi:MAG: diguanylate cyclase [Desulfobacterales bacterium]|nr:diguanylate cyclase [Desulfobacterales bacterium]MCP4161379.1 diguanylate cyclase [Deltaproteobacteria bacterium]